MKSPIINKETITFRLTLKYTLFIFITLFVMSTTTLFAVRYYVYSQSISQIDNISHTIVQKLVLNEVITNTDLSDISQMNENIDINVRKNSKVLFSTEENYDLMIPMQTLNRVISYEVDENNLLYVNEEYVNELGEIIIVQVIKDMDNEREFVIVLFWILLVLNGFAFCISIVLGYLMSKRALKPIEKIVRQAQRITVSDLSQRIKIEGPDDELKRLSETFNELISRIEVGYKKQNRFALDASHELATPLAVIKGYLDIIGRWGKYEPKILDEAIESMKRETKNMTDLLDTLLSLARSDNDISKMYKSEFWMNELLVEIFKEANLVHPLYEFEIIENQSVQVLADKQFIKQMLRAVIDNSVKYSEEGSKISMSCKQKATSLLLSVADEGIGIPKDDLPHIFDRFYRVDKARSRAIGGSGLGLSIVKWIVDIHKGKIYVDSILGEGTTVNIKLPINDNKQTI